MKKLLLKSILLLCALVVGSSAWATVDETHDFSQSLSQLLNNNATISSINIAAQSYPIKKVTVSYRYNNTKKDAVTIAVSVGGTSWGTFDVNGTGSNYITHDFTGTEATGAVAISFTNNTGNGTGHGTFYVNKVTLTEGESAAAGTTAAPTITGNTPFFGTTTATITNAGSADGADIYYTLNGSDPTTTTSATCFAYSTPFSIDATTTVKAIAKKSTDTNASSVVSKTFTKVTPMTVDEALTAISALANNGTIENQCVRGIVTKVSSLYNNTAINYTISDDIAGSNELTVYRGKNMHNTDFAALSDIKLGDDVVIYGTLKKFNTTPEFDQGSYLLYKVSKTAPTFTLSTSAETLSMGTTETVDVTLTTNTDGAITCESSDDDVATVALKSAGVYTITGHMAGTATITIKSALTANYQPASATVAITVNDTREAAGISFTENDVEITWGDAFTGQALTNTHSLPVTWSSTNEAVATVNSSGVVSVLKAGSTDIKASFAGNATYKSTVVGYTLTVNKAEAGLSYDQTSFDIMVGDDSFVAPTLNNPNSLTVNYSSSNGTVATVDAGTGEITYDENTPGSATITAYFAGNDNYKGGNAKYTINIIDPTVKGSKYNPYTVAEVIDGTATGSNIYVRGFIVGEYVGKTTAPRTSSFTTDGNIALAETFTTSPTAAASIPVQLGTDALKSAWGCQTNGVTLLGYEVIVKANKDTYFTVNGLKNTSEVSAVSVPFSPAKTYTTLTSAYALDFTSVSSALKAYIATAVAAGKVQMVQVNKVPAGTGLVLMATSPGTAVNVPVFDGTSPDDVSGNKMAGSATSTTAITANGGYILKDGVFQPALAGTLAAGKAYLNIAVPTSSAPVLEMSFAESDVTAISELTTTNCTNNTNEYFDLQGRKVAQPTKGLYIVNGKKVILH